MNIETINWLADEQLIHKVDTCQPETASNWMWTYTKEPVTELQIEAVTGFLEFLRLHEA